jgi:hypothetical protein
MGPRFRGDDGQTWISSRLAEEGVERTRSRLVEEAEAVGGERDFEALAFRDGEVAHEIDREVGDERRDVAIGP